MANDVGYLSMGLFAVCICSLMKCLFMSSACILTGLFVFSLLNLERSIYLDTRLLSDMRFANIFLKSIACLFIVLAEQFILAEQKFLFLLRSNL